MSLKFLIKFLLIKEKFHPSLKGPKKGTSPLCSPKWGPYGNRRPFPGPYLAYPSGSTVKEPSLQVSLIGLPQRELLRFQSPPSFIFQNPWYTSSLPGSPARCLWRDKPFSRAFFYISLKVRSKTAFPIQIPSRV
jgi:hypothetical protein